MRSRRSKDYWWTRKVVVDSFWQQHAVLRETSTPPPHPHTPLKNGTRLLYCILKIARHLYWVLKKAGPKKVGKTAEKRQKKDRKKDTKKCSKKGGKKVAKNAKKKLWQERWEKREKQVIPKPVLLLSWNRSKTGLVPVIARKQGDTLSCWKNWYDVMPMILCNTDLWQI